MASFAKLFELPNDVQVVVKKTYDDTGNIFNIVVESYLDSVYPTVVLGYLTEDLVNKAFDEYDQTKAEGFIQSIKNLLNCKDC